MGLEAAFQWQYCIANASNLNDFKFATVFYLSKGFLRKALQKWRNWVVVYTFQTESLGALLLYMQISKVLPQDMF